MEGLLPLMVGAMYSEGNTGGINYNEAKQKKIVRSD
jgi:hypothetical protein